MHNSIGNSLIKLLRKRETSIETSIKCQGKSLSSQGNVREMLGNFGTAGTWEPVTEL